jgi:hypothetical protein
LVTASSKLDSKFKIQIIEKQCIFAIDRKPKIAMVYAATRFGCHGINKPKVMIFETNIRPVLKHFIKKYK